MVKIVYLLEMFQLIMKLFIAVLIFNTSFSFAVIFNVTTTDDLPDNMPEMGYAR